jgi:uncharacterized metal-binding protein
MRPDHPTCADCPEALRSCREGKQEEHGPAWCPSHLDPDAVETGRHRYDDETVARIHRESSRIEAEGYGVWTRVEEITHFAKRMGYERIGLAFCAGSFDLAKTFAAILESHGFTVVSVCCKTGCVPKEELGLRDEEKVHPGGFEAICNPITQAEVLNRADCDFNVLLGLCVGHDSLFYRHSEALVTTLVAKDRALGHNPAAALLLANGYFKRVWGPHRDHSPEGGS